MKLFASAFVLVGTSAAVRLHGGSAQNRLDNATGDPLMPALLFSEELVKHELQRITAALNETLRELRSVNNSLRQWQQPLDTLSMAADRDKSLTENNTEFLRYLNASLGGNATDTRLEALILRIRAANDTATRLEGQIGSGPVLDRIDAALHAADVAPAAMDSLLHRLEEMERISKLSNMANLDHAMRIDVDGRLTQWLHQAANALG
mmetsp:Transcript_28687/g.66795  ORF Transcript_28687/g.66795 Transcript_28687/m.66795 type:complete len:207 (-) Transcript_28687:174-794(-)